MQRFMIVLVALMMFTPVIDAQNETMDYEIDCNVFTAIVDLVGHFPLAVFESDGVPMSVTIAAFLHYLDAIAGGNCTGPADVQPESLLFNNSVLSDEQPPVVQVFSSDDYGFEGNLPLITIPAGRYRYQLEGIRRWGDQSKTAEWWIYKINDKDSCWTLLPDEPFGRFSLPEDCSTYWTIYNRQRFPWRIEFIREG